ncbi:heterokaryon incompatibility protein-domain-containing protein [Dichotomopilus funicola]|uniref:Heterokaryon incompatibility protein-domain-containing protein n=1 Tax=Dichotomopilus funicola TaxID=1934379 RepID=A0AAN6UUL3_9PEZI|nr:heterokaryon incompatibility protein-domain-containing protein [Dichotomopilus funicola]
MAYPDVYRPLAPQNIRVFELDPAQSPSDPIVGRLAPQPIDGEAYEAVSYVWGNTKNRRTITIDGATLSVTASLHGSLTAFRNYSVVASEDDDNAGEKKPVAKRRRLWADALCINQDDLSERTSQVELMAQIFAGAERVLAWLGWEEGEEGRQHTRDAIRFVHTFMEDPVRGLSDARVLLHHAGDDDEGKIRYEEQERHWAAVKFFFEIEYFHRTWIVQELGLAREAILHTALRESANANTALEMDTVDWPLVGQFVRFLDYRGASLVTHLGLMSWVPHHILMVWETKPDGTPDCDFLTGMHWTRILGVTDARDRVFGLLGHPLAVMDGQLVIHPDYTVTRGVVYTKLAAQFINKTNNLYVVNLVDHETDPSLQPRSWDPDDAGRMPSWVPDWHSINRTTPLDYTISAAPLEDGNIQIVDPTTGDESHVNTIGQPSTPLPQLLVYGSIVDTIASVSTRMETTDFPITHLARERAKTNPFWLDRIWTEVLWSRSSSGESGLGKDDDDAQAALELLESLSLALPLGTMEPDEPRSKVGPRHTREENDRSFAAYVLAYHELWVKAKAAGEQLESNAGDNNDKDNGIEEQDDKPDTPATGGRSASSSYIPTSSLLTTLPQIAQSELRRRAENSSPQDFIESMTWPSMCRVIYRTTSGLVGMGSRVTRPGDLVCRVRGSGVLMTVRPGDGNGQSGGLGEGLDEAGGGGLEGKREVRGAFIGPTVVPARMERGKWEDQEQAVRFRLV